MLKPGLLLATPLDDTCSLPVAFVVQTKCVAKALIRLRGFSTFLRVAAPLMRYPELNYPKDGWMDDLQYYVILIY